MGGLFLKLDCLVKFLGGSVNIIDGAICVKLSPEIVKYFGSDYIKVEIKTFYENEGPNLSSTHSLVPASYIAGVKNKESKEIENVYIGLLDAMDVSYNRANSNYVKGSIFKGLINRGIFMSVNDLS